MSAMDVVYIKTQLYLTEIRLFCVKVIAICVRLQIRIDTGSQQRM